MIEIPPDRFEEFFSLPVTAQCSDPRFNVRRIHYTEFEPVYDCVDDAFGIKRPRAVYDWLYCHNPYGKAQVWVVEDRATKRVLKTGAKYPWPVWRGSEPQFAAITGDSATRPEWQRKGLSNVRKEVRQTHPWKGKVCELAGPNANSRSISAHRGEDDEILGRLRGAAMPLRPIPSGSRSGIQASLAGLANSVNATLLRGWQKLVLQPDQSAAMHFSPLPRFTADFDEVTLRTMAFAGYWCPHSWKFLNWRYLDHPAETYRAYVLSNNDQPVAYAVLRFAGDRATIAEFAAERGGQATNLLLGLIGEARQAGCAFLTFFSTPAWPHWALFHRAGMIPWTTDNYFEVSWEEGPEDSGILRNWQITPGDRDYH